MAFNIFIKLDDNAAYGVYNEVGCSTVPAHALKQLAEYDLNVAFSSGGSQVSPGDGISLSLFLKPQIYSSPQLARIANYGATAGDGPAYAFSSVLNNGLITADLATTNTITYDVEVQWQFRGSTELFLAKSFPITVTRAVGQPGDQAPATLNPNIIYAADNIAPFALSGFPAYSTFQAALNAAAALPSPGGAIIRVGAFATPQSGTIANTCSGITIEGFGPQSAGFGLNPLNGISIASGVGNFVLNLAEIGINGSVFTAAADAVNTGYTSLTVNHSNCSCTAVGISAAYAAPGADGVVSTNAAGTNGSIGANGATGGTLILKGTASITTAYANGGHGGHGGNGGNGDSTDPGGYNGGHGGNGGNGGAGGIVHVEAGVHVGTVAVNPGTGGDGGNGGFGSASTIGEADGSNGAPGSAGMASTTYGTIIYDPLVSPGGVSLPDLSANLPPTPASGQIVFFNHAGVLSIKDHTGAITTLGAAGTNGTNGTNGATWRTGSDVPSNGTGVDGDLYLRTTTGDVYKRSSGTYSVICNITGPPGSGGSGGGPNIVSATGTLTGYTVAPVVLAGAVWSDTMSGVFNTGDTFQVISGSFNVTFEATSGNSPSGSNVGFEVSSGDTHQIVSNLATAINGQSFPGFATYSDSTPLLTITTTATGFTASVQTVCSTSFLASKTVHGTDAVGGSGNTHEVTLIAGVSTAKVQIIGAWIPAGMTLGCAILLSLKNGSSYNDIASLSAAGEFYPLSGQGDHWVNGMSFNDSLVARYTSSTPGTNTSAVVCVQAIQGGSSGGGGGGGSSALDSSITSVSRAFDGSLELVISGVTYYAPLFTR